MFGLRSSPSTLVVPCSLRGAVTAEAGMGFAPLRLSAPRPKRAVMPIMYYDVVAGAAGDGGAGSVDYSPGTAAVSEYAGVFEAGCDPAQVRASLNRGSRRSATPVLEAQASQAVVAAPSNGKTTAGALEAERDIATPSVTPCYDEEEEEGGGGGGFDDEDVGCLFQLEGVKEERYDHSNRRGVVDDDIGKNISTSCRSSSTRGRQSAGGGMSAHVRRSTAPSAPIRFAPAPAVACSARPSHGRSSPAPGRLGPDLNSGDAGEADRRAMGMRPRAGLRAPAAASPEKIAPTTGAGPPAVFFKPTTLRTPRVIAPPGRRCVSGGMYRLRLSTSC